MHLLTPGHDDDDDDDEDKLLPDGAVVDDENLHANLGVLPNLIPKSRGSMSLLLLFT